MDKGETFAFACWQQLTSRCWVPVGAWAAKSCEHCLEDWQDMQKLKTAVPG